MLEINKLRQLYLGVQGENLAHTYVIDVRPWLVEFPEGSVTIWHQRNGDEVPSATGAVFDDDNGVVYWSPTATDTYVAGEGRAEVRLLCGSVIKKSREIKTLVSDAVTLSGTTLGSGWQDYINAVDALRAAAVVAKQAAESAASDSEAWAVGQRGGVDVEDDDPTYENNAKHYQKLAEDAKEAAEEAWHKLENASATATKLDEGLNPTVSYNPATGVFSFGVVTGDHAEIIEESEKYQNSSSGTVVPTGQWLTEMPVTPQGQFLWIRRSRVWNGGKTVISYERYYTANDGDLGVNIDDEPTEGSNGLPRSAGTYTMIQTKAARVANAVSGNLAALDENGDLTDSGEDPDTMAHKVSGGTTGNLVEMDENGDLADSGEDPEKLAHKVSGGTSGNFPKLDANGDLTDSGKSESSFVADNQGVGNAGKLMGVNASGKVVPIGTTRAEAGYHFGFYEDEEGYICQVNNEEEES